MVVGRKTSHYIKFLSQSTTRNQFLFLDVMMMMMEKYLTSLTKSFEKAMFYVSMYILLDKEFIEPLILQ